MIELENVFKPKKRVFVSLTLASAVIGAMVIYMAWRVALPGLEQINAKLPVVFGGIGIAIALALLAGVAGIVLAILRCAHHEDLLLLGLEGCEYLIPLRRCFRQNF